MPAGGTRQGWAAMTVAGGAVSRTRCWSISGPGWIVLSDKRRIFNRSVEVAGEAGLVGAKRVLDSTPLYDAVATMDTITLIRSAIRGLLKVADAVLEAKLRGLITSGDDYASSAKPQIDWDDQAAREELIHTRTADGYAMLAHLDSRQARGPGG